MATRFNLKCFTIQLNVIAIGLLMNSVITFGYQLQTKNFQKGMDLEICLDHFDIHHDMIIRTQESRNMGAIYLDNADVGNRDECLRLCCETDTCDVFIYEEKNQGTCFLFHCGSAEDFRCKFTPHGNYSSAVFKPPPVQEVTTTKQPSTTKAPISKHERELTNLKMFKKESTSTTTTLIPPLGVQPTVSVAGEKKINCGRFQFQCHSGECIAIYNACDGIPQCVDGSDEGPECHPTDNIGEEKVSSGNLNSGLTSVNTNVNMPSPQLKPNGFKVNNQGQYPSGQINHDDLVPMSQPIYTNIQQQYGEPDSRIFSHKGGLQVPSNSMISPYNPSPLYNGQRDNYNPNEYYNVPMMPPQWVGAADPKYQQKQNWPQQPVQPIEQQELTPLQVQQQQQRPDWPVQPLMPVQIGTNTANNLPNPIPIVKNENKENSDALAKDNNNETSDYIEDEQPTTAPKVKPKSHRNQKGAKQRKDQNIDKVEKQEDHHDQEQYKAVMAEVKMELMDHDGMSEKPGGAVLSLTLGVIVTAALAVLVGCRMRKVGRRVRRNGKTSFAHEADFLVNGMYL